MREEINMALAARTTSTQDVMKAIEKLEQKQDARMETLVQAQNKVAEEIASLTAAIRELIERMPAPVQAGSS